MNPIQKSTFTQGGFVLHKIPAACAGWKISAWYSEDGGVTDVERIRISDRRSGRASSADWQKAACLGRVYRDAVEVAV